jgi:hypothetical protein
VDDIVLRNVTDLGAIEVEVFSQFVPGIPIKMLGRSIKRLDFKVG